MNKRKVFRGGLIATAAIGAAIAFASSASAATSNPDGSVFVSKAEVQTAMHWNNADFDKNWKTIPFGGSVSVTKTNTETWQCGDGDAAQYFVDVLTQTNIQSGATVHAEPVYNAGNHTQITGFTLTPVSANGPATSIGAVVHSNPTAQYDWTMCRLNTGNLGHGSPTLSPSTYTYNNLDHVSINGTDVPITQPVTPTA